MANRTPAQHRELVNAVAATIEYSNDPSGTYNGHYRGIGITVDHDESPENVFDAGLIDLPFCTEHWHMGSKQKSETRTTDATAIIFDKLDAQFILDNTKAVMLIDTGDTDTRDMWEIRLSLMNDYWGGFDADLVTNTAGDYVPAEVDASFLYWVNDLDMNEYINYLTDSYANDYDTLMRFAELMPDVWAVNETSTGYSQGDHIEVFVAVDQDVLDKIGWSDSHIAKNFGDKEEAIKTLMQQPIKLFTYWAWGDVYVVTINGTHGVSAGGYYGDDWATNGVAEYAIYTIDCE